jgi:hypothetical protein
MLPGIRFHFPVPGYNNPRKTLKQSAKSTVPENNNKDSSDLIFSLDKCFLNRYICTPIL